jgi:hypothetical protein
LLTLLAVSPTQMQVMASRVPYITQLHGSSAATATPMGGVVSGDTATARVTGVVRWVHSSSNWALTQVEPTSYLVRHSITRS